MHEPIVSPLVAAIDFDSPSIVSAPSEMGDVTP
jgi:hypothetical protein